MGWYRQTDRHECCVILVREFFNVNEIAAAFDLDIGEAAWEYARAAAEIKRERVAGSATGARSS